LINGLKLFHPKERSLPSLLSVKNLKVSIRNSETGKSGWVLRGIDLDLRAGERVALVGESGCGKSVTALTIMDLLPSPPMRWAEGDIHFKNLDLKILEAEAWRDIRGAQLSMIFQDPFSSLNPVFTVGEQMLETIEAHEKVTKAEAVERILSLLQEVGLPDPELIVGQFPHQLSGGMCQRVMIAMAVACGPSLLIADEPTTALDVTVQAQILEMLFKGLLFITHNLPIIRNYAHRIVILYAGQMVEEGRPDQIFEHPRHPYTRGLLAALPDLAQRGKELFNIPGQVPSPYEEIKGCAFVSRCPKAQAKCGEEKPGWTLQPEGHGFRCFYPFEK
jgi:oligopeptide/dipeptide ABC transporter ATP-binding protein